MSLQSIFGVIESNLTVPSTSSFSTRPARKLSTRGIGKGGGGGGGGKEEESTLLPPSSQQLEALSQTWFSLKGLCP